MTVTVIIADDDTLARTLIEAMLGQDDTLELLGSAEDADGAVDLVREHRPDIAVLDWVMPGGGGPAAAVAIKKLSPETKIVALTSSDTVEAEVDMLRAGAEAFLLKGSAMTDLLRTIHGAVRV